MLPIVVVDILNLQSAHQWPLQLPLTNHADSQRMGHPQVRFDVLAYRLNHNRDILNGLGHRSARKR
jgi:hypothetical protein